MGMGAGEEFKVKKNILIVEEKFKKCFNDVGAEVVTPQEYILNKDAFCFTANVFNLSSSLVYQSQGYYVSLLSQARGHRVFPDPTLIQDLKDRKMQRLFSEELDEMIQRALCKISTETFELSVYFGRSITESYSGLARRLYRLVTAPMFRIEFKKNEKWTVERIRILQMSDLIDSHRDFFALTAKEHFAGKHNYRDNKKDTLFDMAILVNPEEEAAPSDDKALQKFIKAGKKLGFRVDLITKKDQEFILEYDALFIRETTNVMHHTYRIARRAEADGLVVIDDPQSIIKCTNKVFLEELLDRLKLPRPKTYIFGKTNYKTGLKQLTYPCVIKRPDSAFSLGVFKANSAEHFVEISERIFKNSELILVQEFVPTEFDWRIGILGGEVLFACKYYMADGHWQIYNNDKTGDEKVGNFECLDPAKVDPKVLKTALKVAKAIGNGLYGVDLKQYGKDVYVIEINDNPNIDDGVEDQFLGDELYTRVMTYFLNKCKQKRNIQDAVS